MIQTTVGNGKGSKRSKDQARVHPPGIPLKEMGHYMIISHFQYDVRKCKDRVLSPIIFVKICFLLFWLMILSAGLLL